MSLKLKSLFAPLFAVVLLAGCEAQGVDPSQFPGGGGGGSNVPPGSVGDIRNCAVPVTGGLCVLRGDNPGDGLVESLLDPDGPLGPIVGEIDTEALEAALVALLENDDGDLVNVLTNLLVEGQLQEGLTLLLLGADGDGMGALAETLQNLLLPNEDGSPNGLISLFGLGDEDGGGAVGFLQALLIDGTDPNACQAPLGTLCLISGNGTQTGLIDLLLTSSGLSGALSDELTGEAATDELVAILGNLLESNGSVANLVTNLFQEGQLVEGLEVLLMGTGDDQPGLVVLLQGVVGGLPEIIGDVGDFLGGLFPIGGGIGLP